MSEESYQTEKETSNVKLRRKKFLKGGENQEKLKVVIEKAMWQSHLWTANLSIQEDGRSQAGLDYILSHFLKS